MKKWIVAMLALLLLPALAVPALADVIWEPEGNSFYEAHQEDCTHDGHYYDVNGEAGGVTVYTEPDGTEMANAKNGAQLEIGFTYEQNGTLWGVTAYTADAENWLDWQDGKQSGTGWVRMSDLLRRYDEQLFSEEHGTEFQPYDGSFDSLLTASNQTLLVWKYPGSGEIAAQMEASARDDSLTVSQLWKDSDGCVWGKLNYYRGFRGWICLSDPANQNLPVTDHTNSLYPAAENLADFRAHDTQTAVAPETGDHTTAPGLILGVAAVCGITALMLYEMFRKQSGAEKK